MNLFRLLLGRRLANREAEEHKIGAFEGVPAMGLDGLGSSSYGHPFQGVCYFFACSNILSPYFGGDNSIQIGRRIFSRARSGGVMLAMAMRRPRGTAGGEILAVS